MVETGCLSIRVSVSAWAIRSAIRILQAKDTMANSIEVSFITPPQYGLSLSEPRVLVEIRPLRRRRFKDMYLRALKTAAAAVCAA